MKKRILLPVLALSITSCAIINFGEGSLTNSSLPSDSQSMVPSSNDVSSSSLSNPTSSNQMSSSNSSSGLLDDYTLYWEDDFNGNSLSNDWEPQIGDGSNYSVYRWGNNEEQYYKSENATVSGGNLHITARKEKTTYYTDGGEERSYNYTSARLRTTGRITTLYGYIEARIKLPEGTGMWPAFWMLPEGNFQGKWWPTNGEIDIMEAKGRILNKYGATIHTGTSNGQDNYKTRDYTFPSSGAITDFHTYGVEWSTNGFAFYCDDVKFFEVSPTTYQGTNGLYTSSPTAPFDQEFHLLLNLAVGGNYDGGRQPDESFSSAEMLVDYVRIYHRN